MKHFFIEPDREFHIREIARLAKINQMTARSYLAELALEGLLSRKKERGFILYKADTENEMFKEEKRHYNIITIRTSGLLECIDDKLDIPAAIFLFGSYAKAENTKNSDIDLFILSDSKKKLELSAFEKKLGAKIQLFIHSRKEFSVLKKRNPELLNNMLNGIRLSGFLEVF